jgi:hypothetical protein
MTEPILGILKARIDNLPRNTAKARAKIYRQTRDELWAKQRSLPEREFWRKQEALKQAIDSIESMQAKTRSRFVRWLQNLMGRTVEKRLNFYIKTSATLISIGLFASILRNKIDYGSYFHLRTDLFSFVVWNNFLSQKVFTIVLALMVIWIFIAVQISVRTELNIALALFSREKTPKEWRDVTGSKTATIQIIVFLLFFLIMAEFLDDMRFFSAAIAGQYFINWRNQRLFRKNILRCFRDKKYFPPDSDAHKPFILRRRSVVKQYLFENRHLEKELAVAAASLIALAMSWWSDLHGDPVGVAPVIIVTSALVANEVVTTMWRLKRGRRLRIIDDDQELADRLRTGEVRNQ